jgi:hypothetical protein
MNGRSITAKDMRQLALVLVGEEHGLPEGAEAVVSKHRRHVTVHVRGTMLLRLTRQGLLAVARYRGWK